jgi:hypothetical protein
MNKHPWLCRTFGHKFSDDGIAETTEPDGVIKLAFPCTRKGCSEERVTYYTSLAIPPRRVIVVDE